MAATERSAASDVCSVSAGVALDDEDEDEDKEEEEAEAEGEEGGKDAAEVSRCEGRARRAGWALRPRAGEEEGRGRAQMRS